MARRTTWRARHRQKFGPAWAHYFRNYSAKATSNTAKGGFTSHGFRVRVPVLGAVTINLTRKTYTWDNPGPGAVSGSWGK